MNNVRASGLIVSLGNSLRTDAEESFFASAPNPEPIGLHWEIDLQGVCTYADPNWRQGFGYGPEVAVGPGPACLMPADDARKFLSLLANALAEAKPILRFRHRIVRKDGAEVPMECQGGPLHDDSGNLTAYRFVSHVTSQARFSDDQGNFGAAEVDADIDARQLNIAYRLLP